MKNGTAWLCKNAKTLEKYSGRWILFTGDGLLGSNRSLDKVLREAKLRSAAKAPFVLHVPRKSELLPPLLGLKKR